MKTFTKSLMIAAVLGTAISSTSFVASSSAASIEINEPGCRQALRIDSRELRDFLRKNRKCDASRSDRAPARSFEATTRSLPTRSAPVLIKPTADECGPKCAPLPSEEETGGVKGGPKQEGPKEQVELPNEATQAPMQEEAVRPKVVVASEKAKVRTPVIAEEKVQVRVKAPAETEVVRTKAPAMPSEKAAPVQETERAQLMKAN